MRARSALLVAALLVSATSPLFGQVNYDTVQVRSQQLTPGVYMLTGSGGNIGLAVGDDAVFVVDDQFAPLSPKILAAIAAISRKPVRFLVNTHAHFDHVGGNENMANAGALIVAHENVRKRMSSEQFIEALNSRTPAFPKGALPVVTFAEGVTFHINGDSIVVSHVPPAHTDGDGLVFFTRANVLHMGDTFHNTGLPFVDLSSGGSIHGIIGAAEKALAMTNAQTKIIPGHGPLADRARLQRWRDILIEVREKMRTAVAARKTLEQVQADSLTKPYAREWPGGHARFVQLLYQELARR